MAVKKQENNKNISNKQKNNNKNNNKHKNNTASNKNSLKNESTINNNKNNQTKLNNNTKEDKIKIKTKSIDINKSKQETKNIDTNKPKQDTKKSNYYNYDKDILYDDIDIKNINIHHKKNILFLTLIISIFIIIYIITPKFNIYGSKEITINYDEEYIEKGCKVKVFGKDVSKKVTISNNIEKNKVGNYHVNYTYKYLFFNITKKRLVNIIDNKEPVIELENDVINLCPSDDINKIKYTAFDEYDGNLSDKVKLEEKDNRLTLSVYDKSNNYSKIEIGINRSDTEKPNIELSGNSTIILNKGTTYYEPGYQATDNCEGNLTDKVIVNGSVDSNKIGEYLITYTVSDSSNNKSEITRKVIVRNTYLYNDGIVNNGVIYLTFDDGPNEDVTNYILDILKEEGVKATFFVTCNGPDYLIKRIFDEGHTVALHTASHNYSYIYSSVNNYFADLQRVSDRVKRITGEESKIIRFPGGSSNTTSRNFKIGIMSELTSLVLDRGYRYYDWNIDSQDAGGAYNSSQVYYNVVNHLSYNRSNMVLMHDIKYTTKYAIRDIIIFGKNNGYKFDKITMDTYMVRHSVQN